MIGTLRFLVDLGTRPAAALGVRIAAATRTIARDARGEAMLEIPLRAQRSRWWRVTVGDAADVPLIGVRVELLTAMRRSRRA